MSRDLVSSFPFPSYPPHGSSTLGTLPALVAFTRLLLTGKNVGLEKDAGERDRFERLLRHVYSEDGTMVNAILLRDGAQVATFPARLRLRLAARPDRGGDAGELGRAGYGAPAGELGREWPASFGGWPAPRRRDHGAASAEAIRLRLEVRSRNVIIGPYPYAASG